MATPSGAVILQWEPVVGSLEAGKHADLLVIDGRRAESHLYCHCTRVS
jgi:imidazolonepropionase-like amidohydrolase